MNIEDVFVPVDAKPYKETVEEASEKEETTIIYLTINEVVFLDPVNKKNKADVNDTDSF